VGPGGGKGGGGEKEQWPGSSEGGKWLPYCTGKRGEGGRRKTGGKRKPFLIDPFDRRGYPKSKFLKKIIQGSTGGNGAKESTGTHCDEIRTGRRANDINLGG